LPAGELLGAFFVLGAPPFRTGLFAHSAKNRFASAPQSADSLLIGGKVSEKKGEAIF
jgi:hypothetical protein